MPELIPERLIFTAMALNTTSWNLSRILGPALAGFLIAWVADGDTSSTRGVGIVYFMIATLYFVSAATMLLVSKPGHIKTPDDKSPWADVTDGLRYVWSNPPVLGLIMLSIVPFLFGMPLNTLLPAFNSDILGGGPEDLGLLMSCMGMGAILGSLMLASMGEMRNKGLALIAASATWGVLTIGFGATHVVWLAGLVIGCIGWVSAWSMSLNRGMLQLRVAPHMRGRIMSIDMMSHGLMPLGVIPISLIAEHHGIGAALEAAGVTFVLVVLALYAFTKSVRRVDESLQPQPDAASGG